MIPIYALFIAAKRSNSRFIYIGAFTPWNDFDRWIVDDEGCEQTISDN